MTQAIEELMKEHKGILLMLQILEAVAKKLENGEKVDANDLADMLDFIKTFADKCHHHKEEKLLFKEMEEKGFSKENGPLAQMLIEHTSGRNFVKNMSEALEKYQSGDEAASKDFAQNAVNYAELLRQHIEKEDDILYPMAEEALNQATFDKLEKDFEKVEREEIGEGRHEAYHELLHKLKEKYLDAQA